MNELERVILFDSMERYLTDLNVDAFEPTEVEGLDGESRLLFTYPLGQSDVSKITEGCFIAIPDLDGTDEEYLLYEITTLTQDDLLLKAECNNDYYNLSKGDLVSWETNADDPLVPMTITLEKVRYKIGVMQVFRQLKRSIKYQNPLQSLRLIEKEWGGELKFRVKITGQYVIERFVDLLTRRGSFVGNRFEFGHNLQSFSHVIETSHIVTAAYGFGQPAEGTEEPITFADSVWSIANGNAADKPLGQIWVGDENARQLYGLPDGKGGRTHKFYNYNESQAETSDGLLYEAWRVVQLNNFPLVNIAATITDLGSIDPKFSHERARLGDDHIVIADVLGKPIEVKTRIIKFTRRRKDPTNNEVELGNFLPTASNAAVVIEKKLELIDQKASMPPKPDTTSLVDGSRIFGVIDGINAEFHSSLGYVYTDENGIWVFNRPRDENPTKVMLLSGGALLLANKKLIDGNWDWRAFGDGDGFIADEITTGKLDAALVNIVNLNANSINAGKVKAKFLEIGAETTFETNYDPTKKVETVFGSTPPTNKNVIWIDTTDSNNVLWKVWDKSLNDWILGPSGPRGPQGLQGLEGPQGDQGIQGPAGKDGTSSYTHIAYANSADGRIGFSVSDSTNKAYMGVYVDEIPTDSNNPDDYNWTLIKGADGAQGIQGKQGADGRTPYFHIAYATSADGSQGFSVSETNGKTYIGTLTDYVEADSTNYRDYTWAKFQGPKGDQGPQGIQGPVGPNGQPTYVWVKYADTATGGGMSDTPTNKKYIGIAYNKDTLNESNIAGDYTWSLIQGPQGAEGPAGEDGITTYTWVKYADTATGGGMDDSPTGKRFLGMAYNKDTPTKSNNAADYAWSPLYDNVIIDVRNLLERSTSEEFTKDIDKTFAGYNQYFFIDMTHVDDKIEVGDVITISFDVQMEIGAYLRVYDDNGYINKKFGDAKTFTNIGNKEQRLSWTTTVYEVTSNASAHILAFYNNDNASDRFTIANIKIAKSNIDTGHTLAPEDIIGQIDEVTETLTTAFTTALGNTEDTVYSEVGKQITDAEGRVKSYTDSKVLQTENNINFKFTEVNGTLGEHENNLSEIYSYFNFSGNGLKIGKNDSPLQINISNKQLDFIDNGNTVAYVNGQKMYINTAEILQSIIVGNHKIEKYDKNITLVKWVGG